MSEYTAEDFEQAMFAVHPDPDAVDARYAARMNRDPEYPWLLDGVPGNGDEHMARDGWVPVVESRVTDHTLRRVEERAERKRRKLVAHIASVEAAVRDRNRTIEELRHDLAVAQKELADLRQERDRLSGQLVVAGEQIESRRLVIENLLEENYRLDAEADGAISLDGLEAAWEAAEEPTDDNPIREGDVILCRHDEGKWGVRAVSAGDMVASGRWKPTVRILSRAPKPELPEWQALADVLGDFAVHDGHGREFPDVLARLLYERGVTVSKNAQE